MPTKMSNLRKQNEYFEYATTVLKPNLFYFINLFGINNVILRGKVENKILKEARQTYYRNIVEFRIFLWLNG